MKLRGAFAAAGVACVIASTASAQKPTILDRAVARFVDPEAAEGSPARFVMMRELVVESWLAAYERAPGAHPTSFDAKTERAALERHVIEDTLSARLSNLVVPPSRIEEAIRRARLVEVMEIGDQNMLDEAMARAAGVSPDVEKTTHAGSAEIDAVLARRGRAELYLEIAVAQAASITETELRAAFGKNLPFFAGKSYEQALPDLKVFVRGEALRDASSAYYQAVRGRLRLEIVP